MLRGCPSCPLERNSKILFGAVDPVTRDPFDIVECSSCGLARTDPRPEADELDRYYPSGYHSRAKRYLFGLDRSLSLVHRTRIRQIEQLLGSPGSVLDIGCGPGWFLNSMRRRGWTTRGTERSVSAARQAREVLNLDVRAEEIGDLLAQGATFDAVVLWHVAEHLQDPGAALRDVADLLRPGGVVMIGVPNFGSLEARIARAGWFHLDVPRHLFHFTPSTLKALVEAAGLKIEIMARSAPEYDIFSFVQSVENRMGLPFNLLYDTLRRREARLNHPVAAPSRSFAALAAAVPLALLGALWTPLAAKSRCSATMTIYARRPPAIKVSPDAVEPC